MTAGIVFLLILYLYIVATVWSHQKEVPYCVVLHRLFPSKNHVIMNTDVDVQSSWFISSQLRDFVCEIACLLF